MVDWFLNLNGWVLFGFLGQFFFSMRFIIQWISSEKAKRSVVPIAFWYFSLLGGSVLFAYSIYKQDPVFMFGQGLGLFIYIRNLYFVFKIKKSKEIIPNPNFVKKSKLSILEIRNERKLINRRISNRTFPTRLRQSIKSYRKRN